MTSIRIGDFTINTPTDFLINKNGLNELHFSIFFKSFYYELLIMLTRKRLIGYRDCKVYKGVGDFTLVYFRSQVPFNAICKIVLIP